MAAVVRVNCATEPSPQGEFSERGIFQGGGAVEMVFGTDKKISDVSLPPVQRRKNKGNRQAVQGE